MKTLFSVLFCCVTMFCSAQQISGIIADAGTKSPLPFVNIGIPKKTVGTVSQLDGSFNLHVDPGLNNDTIRISMIGYKTKLISVSKCIEQFNAGQTTIYLEEEIRELSEVTIRPRNMKEVELGNNFNGPNLSAGFSTDDLGSELGTVMKIKDGRTYYLKSCGFNFAKIDYDSIIFRVNIYALEKGLPGDLLHALPIYVTAFKGQRNLTVDLMPYDIKIDRDFVLSLEWLQDLPDKKTAVMFCAGFFGNKIVYRQTSQADWSGFPIGIGMWCKAEFEK